jgi:hypothetical protein
MLWASLTLAPHAAEAQAPECVRCGERIGAWEPAVLVLGAAVRRTSRAADPELLSAASQGAVYHAACYDQP